MEEYYADIEDGLYHVFHTETGHSYASYASLEEAEAMAVKWNDDLARYREMNGASKHWSGQP